METTRLGRWWRRIRLVVYREPDAFVGAEPLYVSAKDEIVELVGEHVYDAMVQQLERPNWVPLPHPAVRR